MGGPNGILLTEEELLNIQELHAQGLGARAIATRLRRPRNTIAYHLLSEERRKHYIERVSISRRTRSARRFSAELARRWKVLSEFERGYLSGFIDGEGYLGVIHLNGRKARWMIKLSIASTQREVIDYVRQMLGGGWITYRVPKRQNHSPSWTLSLSSWTLRWLLPQLTLVIKKQHAEILLRALDLMKGRSNTGRHTQELLDLTSELRMLSRKGPKNV